MGKRRNNGEGRRMWVLELLRNNNKHKLIEDYYKLTGKSKVKKMEMEKTMVMVVSKPTELGGCMKVW